MNTAVRFRDSGIPWLGEMPAHWDVVALRFLVDAEGGGTPDTGKPELWDGDIPWVSPKDMKRHEIDDAEDHVSPLALACSPLRVIESEAVLIVVRGMILAHSFPTAITTKAVTINQDMKALRCSERLAPRFLRDFFRGCERVLVSLADESAHGTRKLESEQLGRFEVCVPPLDEQRRIIDYLADQTARLDALVAAKERVLGLLAEKRRALVTRAVTRGLDAGVPLRYSGIPWLGDIPAHWVVTRLKFVAEIRGGLTLGKSYGGAELVEYPYLRVANVQDGRLDLSAMATVRVPQAEARATLLQAGDVLMNEGGDADKVGRGCVWRGEIDPCLHQNHVFAVRTHRVSPEWLDLWTSAEVAKAYFESRARQSTNLASISATHIKELPIPLPPASEREAILADVAVKIAKLDALRSATERTIALLKERRGALITAAVTGKIDVQGAGRHGSVVADHNRSVGRPR